jgi:hypothetical protein
MFLGKFTFDDIQDDDVWKVGSSRSVWLHKAHPSGTPTPLYDAEGSPKYVSVMNFFSTQTPNPYRDDLERWCLVADIGGTYVLVTGEC